MYIFFTCLFNSLTLSISEHHMFLRTLVSSDNFLWCDGCFLTLSCCCLQSCCVNLTCQLHTCPHITAVRGSRLCPAGIICSNTCPPCIPVLKLARDTSENFHWAANLSKQLRRTLTPSSQRLEQVSEELLFESGQRSEHNTGRLSFVVCDVCFLMFVDKAANFCLVLLLMCKSLIYFRSRIFFTP